MTSGTMEYCPHCCEYYGHTYDPDNDTWEWDHICGGKVILNIDEALELLSATSYEVDENGQLTIR